MSARLFEPLALGKITVPNRIAVPPMCQCRADGGLPQAWHSMHYAKMACSGAGLVMVEATAVQMNGRITTRCLALTDDAQQEGLARLVASCKSVAPETKIFLELSHAGRKGGRRDPALGRGTAAGDEGGFALVAPSASRYDDSYPEARALTEEEIFGIITAFAQAARRAGAAGFDGLVLHAAHGYLLHQFLSPVTNRRTDAWGKDAAGRRRFALEVLKAVLGAVPEMPVMMRVSAGDGVPGGWTMDDAVALLKEARALGLTAAEASPGGLTPEQRLPEPSVAAHAGRARRIRSETGLVSYAVGCITDPMQAEAVLEGGDADGVGIGREMIRNPNWGWMAANVLHEAVQVPVPYWPVF